MKRTGIPSLAIIRPNMRAIVDFPCPPANANGTKVGQSAVNIVSTKYENTIPLIIDCTNIL
jgi:hypothetical protein